MSSSTLLAESVRRGIVLRAEGDRLRYKAPPGALTPEFLAALGECKGGLLELLAGSEPVPLPWRQAMADWPVARRDEWGRRANALEDEGLGWREAEQRAYSEIEAQPCG